MAEKDKTRWLVWCCDVCEYTVWLGKKPRRDHKYGSGCYDNQGHVAYLGSAKLALLFPRRLHPKPGGPSVKLEFV